jgi:hypothetical protein
MPSGIFPPLNAPEIANAMLRCQQAAAIIAARQKIVDVASRGAARTRRL